MKKIKTNLAIIFVLSIFLFSFSTNAQISSINQDQKKNQSSPTVSQSLTTTPNQIYQGDSTKKTDCSEDIFETEKTRPSFKEKNKKEIKPESEKKQRYLEYRAELKTRKIV